MSGVSILELLQTCGITILPRVPLVLALLLAGLGASVTHCAIMCSTFVLGQASAVAGKGPAATLLLPYHLGRAATYATLGTVAGLSLHIVSAWPPIVVIRHGLLALAAVAFLALFAGRFLAKAGVVLPQLRLPQAACAVSAISRIAAVKTPWARFGLGVTLGFLPCPAVFAALLAVAANADPWVGAVGMAAFSLGTMPVLMGLSVSGGRLLKFNPRLSDGLSLAALGVNGVILLSLAIG